MNRFITNREHEKWLEEHKGMMATCPNATKKCSGDDWFGGGCPHRNAHEVNQMCRLGKCPETFKGLKCECEALSSKMEEMIW
jgi:hypothetical protein